MNLQKQITYHWLFWSVAVLGLILDLGSKYIIFGSLYNEGRGGRYVLIPEVFQLEATFTTKKDPGNEMFSPLRTIGGETLPQVNHGALFGIGGKDEQGRDWNLFFTIISLVAAAGIIFWATRTAVGEDRLLCLTFGLILAGTLGNLYDRIVFNGVRDFLHWYYWVDWPVFNIADCCLVCGAILLLFQATFQTHSTSENPIPSEGTRAETISEPDIETVDIK